ncbi:MAG: hypothetical protein P8X43_15115 [Maritimibacter sp.]
MAVIDNGTRTTQHVVTGTLADIGAKTEEARLKGPALIVIGSVVTLRSTLAFDGTARAETHEMELGAREGL